MAPDDKKELDRWTNSKAEHPSQPIYPTPTDSLDELVRDLTKVGSIPKSEARRRITEFVASELQKREEGIRGEIEKAKPKLQVEIRTDDDLQGSQQIFPYGNIHEELGKIIENKTYERWIAQKTGEIDGLDTALKILRNFKHLK